MELTTCKAANQSFRAENLVKSQAAANAAGYHSRDKRRGARKPKIRDSKHLAEISESKSLRLLPARVCVYALLPTPLC